jgi:hypothetical protein
MYLEEKMFYFNTIESVLACARNELYIAVIQKDYTIPSGVLLQNIFPIF